ncbi:MAG: HEAT repeat domain-containing protein [Polyangiales bacterium]
MFKSDSPRVVRAAAVALRRLLHVLPEHRSKLDSFVRTAVVSGTEGSAIAELLASVGSPDAVEALKRGLDARDAISRAVCVRGLASIDVVAHREAIAFALSDEDSDVQLTAVRSLARAASKRVLNELTIALQSSFSLVRAEAISAIVQCDPSAVDRISGYDAKMSPVVVVAILRAHRLVKEPTLPALVENVWIMTATKLSLKRSKGFAIVKVVHEATCTSVVPSFWNV